MTNKKYELTDEMIIIGGHTLHRIKALRSFGYVNKGELGGFVECEANLSHNGDCWVSGEATVLQNARVMNNAQIRDHARVLGNACISEHAVVIRNAWVNGDARVEGNARVSRNARVSGNATVKDRASVCGRADVRDYAIIGSCSYIGGYTVAAGKAEISIFNAPEALQANAVIRGDAYILNPHDILAISSIGSRSDILTAYRSKIGGIEVSTGCFQGTLEEFIKQVKISHGHNQYGKEYHAAIAFIKKFFSIDRGLD